MIYNESKYNREWEIKKLSQLGTFARGKSKHRPRNDKRLFEGGGYPLVQTGEIKDANLYITHHSQEYGEFGLKQSKMWDAETLCITIVLTLINMGLSFGMEFIFKFLLSGAKLVLISFLSLSLSKFCAKNLVKF